MERHQSRISKNSLKYEGYKGEESDQIVILHPLRTSGILNQSLRRTLQYLVKHNFEVTLVSQDYNLQVLEGVKSVTIPSFSSIIFQFVKKALSLTKKVFRNKNQKTINLNTFQPVEVVVPFLNDSWLHEIGALIKSFEYSISIFLWFLFNKLTGKHRNPIIWGYERSGALVGKFVNYFFRYRLITSFQGTVLYPWLRFKGKLKTFLRLPFDYIATFIKSDLVIMTEDGTKGDEVLLMLGHSPDRILFLKNGIDEEDILPLRSIRNNLLKNERTHYEFVISYRLDPWKRVDRAIQLAAYLKKKGLVFTLKIIGNGPLESALKKLAEELEVDDRVEFLGRLDYRSTLENIATADMLWSFCDHSNLTNCIQEAIGLGVPVITLADGSTDDFIKTGFLFQVPLSSNFFEDAYVLIKDILERQFDLIPKIPTWEERVISIVDRIRKLTFEGKANK